MHIVPIRFKEGYASDTTWPVALVYTGVGQDLLISCDSRKDFKATSEVKEANLIYCCDLKTLPF